MSRKAPNDLRIRHVLAHEYAHLRELRLASLESDPHMFGSTHARDAARPAQWWRRWASESEDGTVQRTFLLVDGEGRWLGMALVRLDADIPGRAWLGGMWVSPQARGQRAGSWLCDACREWARECGARELVLTVLVGNDAALHVYEIAGFAVMHRQTSHRAGRTVDELLMSCAL